ncbi:MAG: Pup--protein ligase [Bowdeniella nasicola]|nr:Pup--protein ligase [Bowdeniella nasicola]
MKSPRRIFGIETEYGLTCAHREQGEPPLNAEEAAAELFRPMQLSGRAANAFLTNGGRLYLDVGAHPEYATAECDTLEDLLNQDRAGGELMADLARRANARLSEQGIPGVIHLFRNNADSRGNSYGCHENYLIRRTQRHQQVVASLVPFFVTRQIVVGSGYLRLRKGIATYGFSQRADQTWDAVSAATTRSRPIINTRDEPHADAQTYRRMHVIVGDTNVSEAATAAKVAMTDLVIAVAEAGKLPTWEMVDPMRAIREVCYDLTGRTTCDLTEHRSLSAISLQRRYLQAVEDFGFDLTELQRYTLDLWDRALTAIESGEWGPVEHECDWAIKKKMLDRAARRGAALDSMMASRLMLAYHDITDAGLRERMEERGMIRRLTTPSGVNAALTQAPTTTRAHVRGQFIQAAQAHRRDYTADWTHVRLDDGQHRAVRLDDPFASHDERIDKLCAAMDDVDIPWC